MLQLFSTAAQADSYSESLLGPLGLNTVPSARMNETGTVTTGLSTLDPYINAFMGIQIADPLFINLRQSGETSAIKDEFDHLYPGVDIKLRLVQEKRYWPEIALGLNAVVGHKQFAGEYLALSKRHENWDFTAGLGWGAMAGSGWVENPLGVISHFDKERRINQMPNEPGNWFTGDIGVFGGVEYFTPIDNLSLKLDYNGHDFDKEAFGIGMNYNLFDIGHISIGTQGFHKIMGRLSFNFNPGHWDTEIGTDDIKRTPMRPYRTGLIKPQAMEQLARNEGIILRGATVQGEEASALIDLDPAHSAPEQYGHAARHMANHAGRDAEVITLSPFIMNLRGPTVKMLRTDFERALVRKESSADEIWHHTEFDDQNFSGLHKEKSGFFAPWRLIDTSLLLDTKASLAEEDAGILYRTSLVGDVRTPVLYGAMTSGTAVRINLDDNLEKLYEARLINPYGTRGNIDGFTNKRVTIDKSWLGWTHSFTPAIHLSLIGGYLEEMYAGYGGEVLFRPFGPRYAIGAEAWHTYKRDPDSELGLGLNGAQGFTGFLNIWYDVPGIDATLKLKAGQFLAGDRGGALSLEKVFDNGVTLEGFVSISGMADIDPYGGTTHAYNGVRLTIPFHHNLGKARVRTAARLEVSPQGRDSAQSLETPMPLYELTEPFSYRHIERHWQDLNK